MKRHTGFVMLLTLTVLGLVTVMVLNVWFIAGFQRDIVDKRERWYKNFYTTKAALDSVIEKITQCPVVLPMVFDMTGTMPKRDGSCLIVSVARPQKGVADSMFLTAVLRQNNVALCTLRCGVTKKIVTIDHKRRVLHEVRGFSVV